MRRRRSTSGASGTLTRIGRITLDSTAEARPARRRLTALAADAATRMPRREVDDCVEDIVICLFGVVSTFGSQVPGELRRRLPLSRQVRVRFFVPSRIWLGRKSWTP